MTIFAKQLIAGLLLVLFVFIHVVKVFHHHKEGSASRSLLSGKATVKSFEHCDICDYHFTKDADAPNTFVVLQPPVIYLSASHFYILPFTTSIGLPSADRGPPAIV